MARMKTFLAIDLPAPLRQRAGTLMRALRNQGASLRWSDADQLHLTLCFLGDIEDRRIADACAAIETRAPQTDPFEIELVGVGAFPNPQRARVVWIGVQDGRSELGELQQGLRMSLEDHAFVLDRGKYTPHVTLGRTPRGRMDSSLAATLAEYEQTAVGRLTVSRLTLYSSHRERSGPPIYTVLARFELG